MFNHLQNKIPEALLPLEYSSECAVIGAMLLYPEILPSIFSTITIADLSYKPNQQIFTAIQDRYTKNMSYDLILLAAEFKTKDNFPWRAYLIECQNAVAGPTNALDHLAYITDKSRLNRLKEFGYKIAEDASNLSMTNNIDEFITDKITDMLRLRQSSQAIKIWEPQEIFEEVTEDAAKGIQVIKTGYYDLDKLLIGLVKGDYYLIAARPSVGKTALALNIADNIAIGAHEPILIVSCEQGRKSIFNRIACGQSFSVTTTDLRVGLGNNSIKWEEWTRIGGRVANSRLFIVERPGIKATELQDIIAFAIAKYGIKLLILDYIQLMGDSVINNSEYQTITYNSKMIKAYLREYNIPGLILAQLKRTADDRPPVLSDLKGSGSLEQDADGIIFVHRSHEKDDNGGNQEYYQSEGLLILAKQREGPTGIIPVYFRREHTRFELASRKTK